MIRLHDIHELAVNYKNIQYDSNMAISQEEFDNYKTNTGHTYYLYLFNLIKILQPKHILELGTSIGRSANFIMCALPENRMSRQNSKLTTIELGSFMRTDLKPFFNDNRLQIIYGSTTDKEIYAPLNLKNIDFIFIDTLHEYDQVVAEWNIYKNFLTDNAIVVMDDIHLNTGMDKFWNELPYEKIDCGNDVHFSGFGMFRFRTSLTHSDK